MLHSDVDHAVHTSPFRPFRITMADGHTYDVRFREGFVLSSTLMTIGLLPSNTQGTSYDRLIHLDLFSITSIEALPVTVPPQGNGQSQS